MILNTKRLSIVSGTKDHYHLFRDQYEMGPHVSMYLEELKKDPSVKGFGVWFILEKETGKMIGDIGFKGKPNDGCVEIGYAISSTYQNRGFATEAALAMIDWALMRDNILSVKAECLKDNIASIKVLEKIMMERSYELEDMIYWERKKDI